MRIWQVHVEFGGVVGELEVFVLLCFEICSKEKDISSAHSSWQQVA
jgi:hypothetical protein